MAGCAYIKPGGERCKATAMQGYDTCFGHRPDLAEVRRRNASKGGRRGGRGRPQGELGEVQNLLREITDRVLDGEMTTSVGTAVNQILNTRVRLIEVQRRALDMGDLLERLEDLEEQAERLRGA